MKKINRQPNLSINYTESLCKIIKLIKMNIKVFEKCLLNILMKPKMNLLYKHELKKN